MYEKIIFITYLLFISFGLSAQIRLDVEGDAKIQGRIEMVQAPGDSSLFIGANTGINDNGENENVFIGSNAGMNNTSGGRNVFVGNNAGKNNIDGSYNSFFGRYSGGHNSSGEDNAFFGYTAGGFNETGNYNSFFGSESGVSNKNSSYNSFFGYEAGGGNELGESNSFFGCGAGYYGGKGNKNTFLGTFTGTESDQDSLNESIAIGYGAIVDCDNCAVIGGTGSYAIKLGIGTTTPLSDLHIKQSSSHSTRGIRLEYGNDSDFWITDIDNSNDYNFSFNGNLISYIKDEDGAYVIHSDRRLKKNIAPLNQVLEKVLKLKPAQYHYKSARNPSRKSWGFIAQEVEKVFPEIVVEKNGYRGLVYDDFAILSIKAIQELAVVVQDQSTENQSLSEELKKQQTQIAELTTLVQQLLEQNTPKNPTTQHLLELNQAATLSQNQPNPFHTATHIHYFIPNSSQSATLQITALDGRIIKKMAIPEKGKGQVTLKANSYPMGIYHYSLLIDGQVVETKRMVLTQ